LDLPLQAMAVSFGVASAGQGCELWDCQCRPRLQALGLPVQAMAVSFCFLLWQAKTSFGLPWVRALELPLQATAASFCFLLWQASDLPQWAMALSFGFAIVSSSGKPLLLLRR